MLLILATPTIRLKKRTGWYSRGSLARPLRQKNGNGFMEGRQTMKRAVIYARFSSDLQKDASIDDQVALCETIAKRHGFKVVKIYSDRAKSGASMFERDGLLALMSDAKNRNFDAVISESLSRLSRDAEDTPAIYKRLRFNNIQIFDLNGEVTDIHIGI